MNGVRVNNFQQKDSNKKNLDYEFSFLVNTIKDEISGLYWILDDVNFTHVAKDGTEFDDYQNNYQELIVAEKSQYKLTKINFIIEYAKFIVGDNDRIIGIDNLNLFQSSDSFGIDFVEENAKVYLSCIDRLYWEVYSRSKEMFRQINKVFANVEPCNLSDCW